MELVIVPTGVANLASVKAAFRRLLVEPEVSAEPDRILAASHVMLPGVGAFGPAIAALRRSRADWAILERIARDRPLIAICVGHQLLFRESEESPGEPGLAVIDAVIRRFPDTVRVPQFGWNLVTPHPDSALVPEGHAYFANSYRALDAPGWTVSTAEHGGPFVAAVERGSILGCQFHPELSGPWGQALLAAFLDLEGRC
jgi:imidazole glycerol phosphate synthase glutamine amidotransferase subunit